MLVREVAKHLDAVVAESHAVIIADQVSEPDCGVMCLAVRERLAELAQRFPDKIILADSRNRIAQFRGVIVKPNWGECLRSVGVNPATGPDRLLLESSARQLIRRTGRSVYCTIGEQGMLVIDRGQSVHVTSFSVSGPIDIVGAGDSATAGIVCALCDQADAAEAAELGNLIASITIQQLGSTGTATPDQILARWREVTEP